MAPPPSSTTRAPSPPTPPKRLPKRAPKQQAPIKKKPTLSAKAFAEMALINIQGREDPKPLPRPRIQHPLSDEESEVDDEDSENDDLVSLPDTTEVIPHSPNYNPDLSDDEMSRSPSPFRPVYAEYSQHENTRYPSHVYNVPSAHPESYFQKSVPRSQEIYVNKPTGNGTETVKTKLPVAYWRWPTGADEHKADQERKSRTRENYVQTPYKLVAVTLPESELRIAVHGDPKPPHINWIQRKRDAEENARTKATKAAAAAAELAKAKKAHRELMESHKDLAEAAVLATMTIDDDGFYKVKGTRKRLGPGVDTEKNRKRRIYIWKNGKAPLRGRALKKEQARLEEAMKAQMEKRAEEEGDGTDSEESAESADESEVSEDDDEEDEEDEEEIISKPFKDVAKGTKTVIPARPFVAPQNQVSGKPPARKQYASKQQNADANRDILALSSDESDSDEALISTANALAQKMSRVAANAVAKKPSASMATPASTRRTSRLDDKDAEQTANSPATPAKRITRNTAAKKTAISSSSVPSSIQSSNNNSAATRNPTSSSTATSKAPSRRASASGNPVAKKIIAPKKRPSAKSRAVSATKSELEKELRDLA